MPKKNGRLGGKRAAEVLAALVERHFELGQRVLVELALRQVDHGLDRRDDAWPRELASSEA